jgi:cob(I)alamin adenosyltransferase
LEKGYIHIYTGNGKGKTTSSIGLGIRACGAGKKVHMVQFMKGRRYSEINTIEKIENFTISQHGRDEFVSKENPKKIDIDMAREGFNFANEIILKNKYDMVILDEINVAVDFKLIKLNDLLKLIEDKPDNMELILTGRYADKELIKIADLVTEMIEIKHPYNDGILARKGIDY